MQFRSKFRRTVGVSTAALAMVVAGACSSSGGNDADTTTTVDGGVTTTVDGTTTTTEDSGVTTTTEDDGPTPTTSGGGGDYSEQDFANAITTSMSNNPEAGWETGQIACMGEGVAETIGVDGFEDADITPDDLASSDRVMRLIDPDEALAEDLAVVVEVCVGNYKDLLMNAWEAAGLNSVELQCLDDGVTPDILHDIIKVQILDDDFAENFPDLVACEGIG